MMAPVWLLVAVGAHLCGLANGALHVFVYTNRVELRGSLMLATASANGFNVVVTGVGDNITWGPDLINKFKCLQRYLHQHVADDDLLLFTDNDVLFLGTEAELISKFEQASQRSGHAIFFNGEASSVLHSHGELNDIQKRMQEIGNREQDRLAIPRNPFWSLNSGLFIGRGSALKWVVRNYTDIPNYGATDQEWLQDVFVQHPQLVAVDHRAEMLLAVQDVMRDNGDGLWGDRLPDLASSIYMARDETAAPNAAQRRVVFRPSGGRPVAVHFPGEGHWMRDGSCVLLEVLQRGYPGRSFAALGYDGEMPGELPCGMHHWADELREANSKAHFWKTCAGLTALVSLGWCLFRYWPRRASVVHPHRGRKLDV